MFVANRQKIRFFLSRIIDSIHKGRKSKLERRRIRVVRLIIAPALSQSAGIFAGASCMPSISIKTTAIIKTTTKTV